MRILLLASSAYDSQSKRPPHLHQGIDELCDYLADVASKFVNITSVFGGNLPGPPELMPSWVPQWEYSDRTPILASIYACSGTAKAVMEVIPNKHALEVLKLIEESLDQTTS